MNKHEYAAWRAGHLAALDPQERIKVGPQSFEDYYMAADFRYLKPKDSFNKRMFKQMIYRAWLDGRKTQREYQKSRLRPHEAR